MKNPPFKMVGAVKQTYHDLEFVTLHERTGTSYDFCYDRFRIRYDNNYKVIYVVQG
jgi:hypothetical protein